MKIISLNVASGLYFENLMEFITEHKATTDLFCFQEVSNGSDTKERPRKNLFADLCEILWDCFTPIVHAYEKYADLSLVTFIHNKQQIAAKKWDILTEYLLPEPYISRYDVGMCLVTDIMMSQKTIRIMQLHGVWYPPDKLDSPEREIQCHALLHLINENNVDAHILLWDFNLHPETTTIKTLAKQLVNLNERFGITDTRGPWTRYYWTDQYQPYADYAFTSASIPVRSYTVEEKILSDHKALILEIDD